MGWVARRGTPSRQARIRCCGEPTLLLNSPPTGHFTATFGMVDGTLPMPVAAHANPDHQEFGSANGGAVDVSASAMVTNCNASIGTSGTTVARHYLPPYRYVEMGGSGTSELVMTGARGGFQARFGSIDGSNTASRRHSATLIVLDQHSRPLVQETVTAAYGAPGAVLWTWPHDAPPVWEEEPPQGLAAL